MIRGLLFVFVSSLASSTVSFAQEDPVEQKLVESKAQFESATENARTALIEALQKKEDSAKKSGNLQLLLAVQADVKAFEENGDLPKSVPTGVYEGQMKRARVRLEAAYSEAVKLYTKDGSVELAKAVQKELDEFKIPSDTDTLKKGTVWRGMLKASIAGGEPKSYELTITILDRAGKRFTARYEVGGQLREITGTIERGKIQWLAKDVKVIRGSQGFDYTGKVENTQVTLSYSGTTKDGRTDVGTAILNLLDSKR